MILKGTVLFLLGIIYLPLILIVIPLFDLSEPLKIGIELIHSAQFLPALKATLTSTVLSMFVALCLSAMMISSLLFTTRWQQLTRRIPYLLAFPHLVFAVGLFVLIGPKGWFERLLLPLGMEHLINNTFWLQDRYGVSLGVTLGIKEAWFLCWILWAHLHRFDMQQFYLIGQTLGYGRLQIMVNLIWPQLLPVLKWPLVAITAYSLSSIEMALVLGPTNPPTLAILGWQMLLDADLMTRQKGLIVSLLLVVLLGVFSCLIQRLCRRPLSSHFSGKRWKIRSIPGVHVFNSLFLLHVLLVALILLWSFAASWFYPDLLPNSVTSRAWESLSWKPFENSLVIGLSSSLLIYAIVVLLLEVFPSTHFNWLIIPILIPALPLVVAQHQLLTVFDIGPSGFSVFWAHLIFVFPYVFLLMVQAYRQLDEQHLLVGRTLGLSQWSVLFKIKLPLLVKPSMAAVALGFTVSLAQYLPTQFIGGGRIETLTTETLTRYAGGDKRVLGAHASLLMLQALFIYLLAVQCPKWIYAHRKGMH